MNIILPTYRVYIEQKFNPNITSVNVVSAKNKAEARKKWKEDTTRAYYYKITSIELRSK